MGILVLGLMWCNVSFPRDYIGKGELQLTDAMAYHLIKYIKGEDYRRPMVFYVTTDGTDGLYMYCPETQCRPSSPINDIIECERRAGIKFKMFARGKYIKWKNGINPGKDKITKIDSRLSKNEILAKLTELGFYKNSTTIEKPKIIKKRIKKKTKKITKKTTSSSDLTTQLKELKQLLDDGVITEEEFTKAKKKLLD